MNADKSLLREFIFLADNAMNADEVTVFCLQKLLDQCAI